MEPIFVSTTRFLTFPAPKKFDHKKINFNKENIIKQTFSPNLLSQTKKSNYILKISLLQRFKKACSFFY